MRSCEYSTTPKGEDKRKRILQKGDIRFYRKRRELFHDSGILHLADKVSPNIPHTEKWGQEYHSDTVADNHNPLPSEHLGGNHRPTLLIFRDNKCHTSKHGLGGASKNDNHLTDDNKFTKGRHTFLW